MKRSNTHIVVGCGFVLASLLGAGGIYFGIKVGTATSVAAPQNQVAVVTTNADVVESPDEAATQEIPVAPEQSNASAIMPAFLVGNFSTDLASGYTCDGLVWSFSDDGTFTKVGPDDDGLTTNGKWQLADGILNLSEIVVTDGNNNVVDRSDGVSYPVIKDGDKIWIGKKTYSACATN